MDEKKADDYECHINVDFQSPEQAQLVAGLVDWKVSTVEGDPELGDTAKYLLTRHYTTRKRAESEARRVTGVLSAHGLTVKRLKIEYVVLDERSGW